MFLNHLCVPRRSHGSRSHGDRRRGFARGAAHAFRDEGFIVVGVPDGSEALTYLPGSLPPNLIVPSTYPAGNWAVTRRRLQCGSVHRRVIADSIERPGSSRLTLKFPMAEIW